MSGKNFPAFFEAEGLFTRSQEPVSGCYPQRDESIDTLHKRLPMICFVLSILF